MGQNCEPVSALYIVDLQADRLLPLILYNFPRCAGIARVLLEKLARQWMRPIDQLIDRWQTSTAIHVVSTMSAAQVNPERIVISRLNCVASIVFHLYKGWFAAIKAGMLHLRERL